MTVNDSSRGVPSFLDFPPSPCHAMLGRLTYDSEKAILSLSLVFSELICLLNKAIATSTAPLSGFRLCPVPK